MPYDRAKEMVAEGLKLLGENYQAILREGYESGWIDVMENQGKTSGAIPGALTLPIPMFF